MAQLGVLEYLISVDSSKLNKGINESDSKMKSFGNRMSAWTVAKGQMIERVAEKAVMATGRFLKGSVQESMTFDKSMSQVAATLGKTTAEVKELEKFARKMGSETAFTATEAAEALNYMALAGYDSEKSMKMLPHVLNLAAAGNFDLARASDMVTDAQSALGLSIEDTEVMVDQMAKTASKSNTSVEQLGEAILTVGGTAKQMKGGTKELTAVLGVLADNGIKGSEGGTMLRNVLMRLTAPTDKAAKQLKQLGVEAFDADGNLRGLPDILTDFNEAMTGKTAKERAEIFSEIFNVRDLKGVEALLGTSTDRWKELYSAIDDSAGAAKQMAETQLDNLSGDVTKFKSALGETKLAIVEGLTPSLRNLVRTGTAVIQRLTNAFKKGGFKAVWQEMKAIFKDSKSAIAEWLHIETPENASWWQIGKAMFDKIKDGFKGQVGKTKIRLANWLGLTDENGGMIDDADDASWFSIAKGMYDKIQTKFKEAASSSKIRLANWLGLTDQNGNTISDADQVSWANIGSSLFEKIKNGFKDFSKKTQVNLAQWLGLTDASGNVVQNADDTSWSKIGSEIIKKISAGAGKAGDFLMQLILGDEYQDGTSGAKSTWMDVGKKISTWISQSFEEGGILDSLIKKSGEKLSVIAKIAEEFISGIADWIGSHTTEFGGIVTNLVEAIGKALPGIASALSTLLKDEGIQKSIGDLFVAGFEAAYEILVSLMESIGDIIGKAIFGEEWYAMKERDKKKVLTDTGSYKEGDEDWNKLAEAIDEKYKMHVTADTDLAGGTADELTSTMTHLGITIPALSKEVDQLRSLVNLRKSASEIGDKGLYEMATAGIRAFGDSYKEGLRGFDLTLAVEEAMKKVGEQKVKITPEFGAGTAEKIQSYLRGIGARLPVSIVVYNENGDVEDTKFATGESFAKGSWNIPNDMYAKLHQGEIVMTASQARRYREGENEGMDYASMGVVVANAVDAAMQKVYVLMSGEKVGDLTTKRVKKNLNAKSYSALRAMGG